MAIIQTEYLREGGKKKVRIDWGKVLTSKTLWLNVIGCAIAIIQVLSGEAWFDPKLQVLILGVLNAFVRFLTNDSLKVEN